MTHVLFVDDDSGIRAVAKLSLEMHGWQVTEAVDGQDGLDKLPHTSPDLIVLDIMMPNLDGIQTYDAIRKLPQFNHIPIVFLSAKDVTPQADEREAGVLRKPFDPMTLPTQLEGFLK